MTETTIVAPGQSMTAAGATLPRARPGKGLPALGELSGGAGAAAVGFQLQLQAQLAGMPPGRVTTASPEGGATDGAAGELAPAGGEIPDLPATPFAWPGPEEAMALLADAVPAEAARPYAGSDYTGSEARPAAAASASGHGKSEQTPAAVAGGLQQLSGDVENAADRAAAPAAARLGAFPAAALSATAIRAATPAPNRTDLPAAAPAAARAAPPAEAAPAGPAAPEPAVHRMLASAAQAPGIPVPATEGDRVDAQVSGAADVTAGPAIQTAGPGTASGRGVAGQTPAAAAPAAGGSAVRKDAEPVSGAVRPRPPTDRGPGPQSTACPSDNQPAAASHAPAAAPMPAQADARTAWGAGDAGRHDLTTLSESETEDVVAQVMSRVRVLGSAAGERALEVHLRPEHLGRIVLRVSGLPGGPVNAVLRADRPEIAGLLRNRLGELAQALSQQGLRPGEIEVSTPAAPAGAQNGQAAGTGQGYGRHHDGQGAAPRAAAMATAAVRAAAGTAPAPLQTWRLWPGQLRAGYGPGRLNVLA